MIKERNLVQIEEDWESRLKIRTTGRDDSISDHINYPYEPTNYQVLERICNESYIRKSNCLLDYGCGKGRVGFFVSFQTRCRSIGIDYDDRMIQGALKNKERAVSGRRTEFFLENAGTYEIPADVDRIYFFNPFSVEILGRVLERILDSYYECPREILLFFYYPSDEYMARLMREDELDFMDEISCEDLFDGKDSRERVMIFRVGYPG